MIGIALIDRDLRITLHRFWHALSLFEKIRMVYILAVSVLSTGDEKIDVEELKKQDVMEMAMAEFRKFSPNGARALIDERDAYLADQIIRLLKNYERVLVVIGAGHVEGVKKFLDAPETLPPIEDLVKDIKPVPWGKIFGIGVTLVFALFLAAIAFSGVGMGGPRHGADLLGCHPWGAYGSFHPCGERSPAFCTDRICCVVVYCIKSINRSGLVLLQLSKQRYGNLPHRTSSGSSKQKVLPKCGKSRCSAWSSLQRWQMWGARLEPLRTSSSLSRSSMLTPV